MKICSRAATLCAAAAVATAQTSTAAEPSSFVKTRFAHMMADDDYFTWKELVLDPSIGEATVLVLACGSKPDIDAKDGKRLTVAPVPGGYTAATFRVHTKKGLVRIAARPGKREEVGLPLYIVGAPVGTTLNAEEWLGKVKPCQGRGQFADVPTSERFKGWDKLVGSSAYSQTGKTVFDYEWLVPNRVIWMRPRVPGRKGDPSFSASLLIFDEYHGAAYQERIYGNDVTEFAVTTPPPADMRIIAYQSDRQPSEGLLGGLGKVLQGAVAGAAGMASGGGGSSAAIAGAIAGAAAGGAGVDASTIQSGFNQGTAEFNAQNAEMERQLAVNTAPDNSGTGGDPRMTSTRAPAAVNGAGSAIAQTAGQAPKTSTHNSTAPAGPQMPSSPQMCTTPGGSREWSTGGLSSAADAQAQYDQEAAFQRGKGSSMGPMRASGKTIMNFGVPYANYVATITWPAKSVPCSAKVSPQ